VLNPILNPLSGEAADDSCPKSSIPGLWSQANTSNSATAGSMSAARVSPWNSIVYSFKTGDSPETIRQNFPSLTLEQVYGAIAFYLAHEQEVDSNIREGEEEIQRSIPPLSESRPELFARLERARHQVPTQDLAKH
jgi:hypothetical protein